MTLSCWMFAVGVLLSPDDTQGTIEIEASGTASAPVVAYEVRFKVSASSELAADAIQKFSSIKKRLKRGFAEAEVGGLVITGEEFEVSPNAVQDPRFARARGVVFVNGVLQHGGDPNRRMSLSEVIVVTVPVAADVDLETALACVSEVVDTGLDLELDPVAAANPNNYNPNQKTGPAFIVPRVADVDALQARATKDAVDSAREDAEHIAKAAGVTLGKATAITIRSSGEVGPDRESFIRASRSVTVRVSFAIE